MGIHKKNTFYVYGFASLDERDMRVCRCLWPFNGFYFSYSEFNCISIHKCSLFCKSFIWCHKITLFIKMNRRHFVHSPLHWAKQYICHVWSGFPVVQPSWSWTEGYGFVVVDEQNGTKPYWLIINQSPKVCKFWQPRQQEETGSCNDVTLCFELFPLCGCDSLSFVFSEDMGGSIRHVCVPGKSAQSHLKVYDGSRKSLAGALEQTTPLRLQLITQW